MRPHLDPRSVKIGLAIAISLLGLVLLPVLALPYDGVDWADYDPVYRDGPCCSSPAVPAPAAPPATATVGEPPAVTTTTEIPCAELPAPGEALAVEVNGRGIGLAAFEREFDQFLIALRASGVDPESPESQAQRPAWRQQVLDLMIEDVLIQQAAVETGLDISEQEVQAQVTQEISQSKLLEWFEDWLVQTGQTRAEFERDICQGLLVDAVRQRVTAGIGAPEQARARQIVVANEQQAQRVLARLQAGRPFVAVAQEYSLDAATRDNGGNLGWLVRHSGRVPPQVEDAAFAGQPGQVQGPLAVNGRFVIVETVEVKPGKTADPAVLEAERAAAFKAWLAARRAAAQIQILAH